MYDNKRKVHNIIISLIGMTGVGKTTVGQALAEKLSGDFLDLDFIITGKTNKTPSEIFSVYGEETFRKIETEELENIIRNYNYYNYNENSKNNLILSCGGGIVLKEKNRETIKKNSFVVWLLRPVSEIIKNSEVLSRPPINNDIDNYIKIFKQRESLYSETCDLKIDYTDVCDAVETIFKAVQS